MEMLLRLCCVTLVIVTRWNFVDTLSHTQTLMWCQKQSFFGPVGIVGIQGSPDVWMSRGYFQAVSSGAPVDLVSRYQSHRIALAYRYSTHNLFWSDRGLKNIYRVELEQHAPGVYHNYTAQLTRVYHGSSSQVNGIAVDWLSGAIYWTDALYNWISVAASGQDGRVDNLYRRLWVTGLDRPHGIAVHPMRGWLFWNDWGSVPKIERSTLHGTERTTLIDTALNRPQGMTIDFEHDRLYWVDDYRDTVNYMALDGGRRSHFNVHQNNNGLGHLFGIALSENFVFVTDQLDPSIKIYHKHDETFLGMIALHNSVPYDILMYDEKHQPIDGQTPCSQMNCEHFCVSTADGTGQCICSEGFDLQDSTCVENDYLHQPAYIYSASHAICSSPIHLADRTVPIADDIDCFIDDVEEVMALGYDAHADLLFYSDDSRRDIRRHRQVAGDEAQVLAVQTGHVRGLSVDWLVGNLFYTDADAGTINVMNTDGRYPTTLMEGLSNPRSLAVNPLQGKMYWSSPDHDSIRWANMDGTEHLQFADNCVQPDGLALLPQADKQRLYWVEDSQEYNIGGIMSKKLDGTDLKLERRWRNNLFRDLAIFNDYMVWTDGYGNVIFAEQGQEPRRGLTHSPHKSHDIIAYSDVNQPLGISKCDSEYGGCSQLCIPMPDEQRVCKCTYGYYLAADEMTCISDLTDTNFILFVDPYHKNLYQLDFDLKETGSPRLHSRALRTAEFPHKFAFNPHDGMIFWIDRYSHVIKSSSLITEKESIVYTLSEAAHVGAMAYTIDTDVNWLFFSDQFTKTINYIDIVNNGTAPVLYAAEVDVDEMVVDEADSMIYWTHRASTGDTGGIYKGRLSGSSQGLVHPEIDQITSLALDRSNDRLIYCTSTTVYAISKRGDLVELLLEQPNATFSNIVVLKDDLYVTMTEERQVYRLRATNGWVQETVSDPIFSRITDMKADVATSVHFTIEGYTTPTTPAASTTPAAFTGTTEKLGVFDRHIKLIAISAAGGFLLLLIICIILVCCLCRTKTEEKKKPPPSDAERNAHDNPTYATTVIAEEPIYSTVGALQASGGRDPDLPDLVSDSEEKKVPLDASQQKNTTDGSTNSGYVVDPDDEQLVEPEEVTVHIDSSSGPKVKFQNSRED